MNGVLSRLKSRSFIQKAYPAIAKTQFQIRIPFLLLEKFDFKYFNVR